MRKTYSRYSDQLDMETIDLAHAFTVFEPEERPRFTGILDARGQKIMVTEKIDQIGFIRKPFDS